MRASGCMNVWIAFASQHIDATSNPKINPAQAPTPNTTRSISLQLVVRSSHARAMLPITIIVMLKIVAQLRPSGLKPSVTSVGRSSWLER